MYNSIELDTYYHNKYLVQYSYYIEQADTLRYASQARRQGGGGGVQGVHVHRPFSA